MPKPVTHLLSFLIRTCFVDDYTNRRRSNVINARYRDATRLDALFRTHRISARAHVDSWQLSRGARLRETRHERHGARSASAVNRMSLEHELVENWRGDMRVGNAKVVGDSKREIEREKERGGRRGKGEVSVHCYHKRNFLRTSVCNGDIQRKLDEIYTCENVEKLKTECVARRKDHERARWRNCVIFHGNAHE